MEPISSSSLLSEKKDGAARVRASRSGKKTALTMAWALAFLLVAEGGVRGRAWYRHGSDQPVPDIFDEHPRLGRIPRPGAKLNGRQRKVTINRYGFRGVEVPPSKPAGTIRIAAIGDSTTFGLEASSDDAVWVARMTAALDDSGCGLRFDAINGAVPGYTLSQSTASLTERIAPLDPDIVVIYQVGTDIAGHARREIPRNKDRDSQATPAVAEFVQKHSLLFNLIRVNMVALSDRYLPREKISRLSEGGLRRYRNQLERTIDLCRDRGWGVILCTCPRAFGDPTASANQHRLAASALAQLPELSLAGLNDAYERYNQTVRDVAREKSVPLVDLARLVPKRKKFFADSVHLSDLGHRKVGVLVAGGVLGELAGACPTAGVP